MGRKYQHLDGLAGIGFLINAMDDAGGDRGVSFPRSDAEDLSCGCRFIPGEVTMARRAGRKVQFVSDCSANCWYWLMPDGSQIYHYDPMTYHEIARLNGKVSVDGEYGKTYPDGVGPCPHCGNANTNGGTVKRP